MLAYRVFVTIGFDAIYIYDSPRITLLLAGFFKLFFSKKFVLECSTSHHAVEHKKTAWWQPIVRFADITLLTDKQEGEKVSQKLFTLHPSVDLELIKGRELVNHYKKNRPSLVSMNNMSGQQDVECFMEIVRFIVEDEGRRDIQFLVIEEGRALKAHKKLAAILAVTDYITFAENITEHILYDVLSASDIGVCCTKNGAHDTCSDRNIMHYMMYAKPTVQSDTANARRLAEDASLYASPHDSHAFATHILDLLSDNEKRTEMGKAGRARIEENYNWASQAPILLEAYNTLFNADKNH